VLILKQKEIKQCYCQHTILLPQTLPEKNHGDDAAKICDYGTLRHFLNVCHSELQRMNTSVSICNGSRFSFLLFQHLKSAGKWFQPYILEIVEGHRTYFM